MPLIWNYNRELTSEWKIDAYCDPVQSRFSTRTLVASDEEKVKGAHVQTGAESNHTWFESDTIISIDNDWVENRNIVTSVYVPSIGIGGTMAWVRNGINSDVVVYHILALVDLDLMVSNRYPGICVETD